MNQNAESEKIGRPWLVNEVAEKMGWTKTDSEKAVSAVIDAIEGALVAGKTVSLVGFGKFSVKLRDARMGRNPQNPTVEIPIPATNVVKFSVGGPLAEKVAATTPQKASKPVQQQKKKPVGKKK